jgi:hypothetical protein
MKRISIQTPTGNRTLYGVVTIDRLQVIVVSDKGEESFDRSKLTSIVDHDVALVWDRTRDPQPKADGSVPDQDDIQWLLTLGIDF